MPKNKTQEPVMAGQLALGGESVIRTVRDARLKSVIDETPSASGKSAAMSANRASETLL